MKGEETTLRGVRKPIRGVPFRRGFQNPEKGSELLGVQVIRVVRGREKPLSSLSSYKVQVTLFRRGLYFRHIHQ